MGYLSCESGCVQKIGASIFKIVMNHNARDLHGFKLELFIDHACITQSLTFSYK